MTWSPLFDRIAHYSTSIFTPFKRNCLRFFNITRHMNWEILIREEIKYSSPRYPWTGAMVSAQDQGGRVRQHGHGGGRSHHRNGGHRRSSGNHHGGQPSKSGHRYNRPAYDRSRVNDYNRYKYADEDFESIISPCVKYSLFFFNFIFWVSDQEIQTAFKPHWQNSTCFKLTLSTSNPTIYSWLEQWW